jgi:hypothetical membrane protein
MPSTIFSRAAWTVGVASVLAVGAGVRYPGGTLLDTSVDRYSMSLNFLSDLGMTAAYDGEPNRLGASLFVASLLLLVVGLGQCLVAIVRLHGTAIARRWARVAGVCGLLACVAFTGVAVTPENRVMSVHLSFTRWGWRFVPLAAGFMAFASRHAPQFRLRAARTWLLVTILLAAYAALLEWGPGLDSLDGLRTQVLAQKAAAVVLTSALLVLAREADRVRSAAIAAIANRQ